MRVRLGTVFLAVMLGFGGLGPLTDGAAAQTAQAVGQPICYGGAVSFETSKRARFRVEIVDTPDTRAQGLMHRTSLSPSAGMLFVYEHPQPAAFWMRNTLIPLDMIFLDAAGTIRHIHRNAIPHDETPIFGHEPRDPDPNRLYVLEIAGGRADEVGLREGMVMHLTRNDACD